MAQQASTPPVLSIAGEIDLATCGALTELLAPALAEEATELVLLTHDVTFIDCAGLGPLHHAASHLRRCGGRLWLPLPAKALVRLARLTGCTDVLGIPTVESDVARWRGEAAGAAHPGAEVSGADAEPRTPRAPELATAALVLG